MRGETIPEGGSLEGQKSRDHGKLGPWLRQDSVDLHLWLIRALRQTAGHFATDQLNVEGEREFRCWLMAHGACGQGTNRRVGGSAKRENLLNC